MKIYTYLFCLIPFFSISQNCEIPSIDGKFQMREIVELENTNKIEIFNATIIALSELLKKQGEFIELRSLKEGVILAKFSVWTFNNHVLQTKDHYFNFLLRFEFKEDRYRTTVNYLNHQMDINGEFVCSCPNDFLESKCGVNRGVFKNEWKKQKCKAVAGVDQFLRALEKQIIENIRDTNW